MRAADDCQSSCHAWGGSEAVADQRSAEEAGRHDEDLQHLTSLASLTAARTAVDRKTQFLRLAT